MQLPFRKTIIIHCNTSLNRNDGRRETNMAMSIFSPKQQPELIFVASFEELTLDRSGNEKLALLLPVDGLETQPHVITPVVL
jgi:hypothetical protein